MSHVNKQMISFFLTSDCNLRCIYCYNAEERGQREVKTLSLDFAKRGIDDFFSNNESRHIRFYGPGEPTQAFDLMRHIKDYAHSIAGDKLSAEIQTNGAFGPRVRDWIADNINIVWISFDGPPDIQNHNRPFPGGKPSSSVIEANVKYLLEHRKKPTDMVGARITMSDQNIKRQREMIDYFAEMGIRYMWSNPLFPSVEDIPVCQDETRRDKYYFDMDTYVEQYIDAFRYAKEKGVFYGSFLTCNFDGESKFHCRSCTPVPHLTPDGYVSACDMASFGENSHHMEAFIIGKWNEDTSTIAYYPEKMEALRDRSTDHMEHCKDCKLALRCGGYCLGEVMNETGSLFGQKPKHCEAIKKIAAAIGFPDKPYPYLHP